MQDNQLENVFPKSTQKRRLLLRMLAMASKPVSVEELYTAMQEQLPLNRSTVYRALAFLTEKGLVQRTVGDDSVAYYSLPEAHQMCIRDRWKTPSLKNNPFGSFSHPRAGEK